MFKRALLFILLSALVLPSVAFGAVDSIQSLSIAIARVVWIVFTVIAVICFVIAGVMFLTAQGDPGKLKLARDAFLWGLAGVAVGIVAFSIISLTCSALGGC